MLMINDNLFENDLRMTCMHGTIGICENVNTKIHSRMHTMEKTYDGDGGIQLKLFAN